MTIFPWDLRTQSTGVSHCNKLLLLLTIICLVKQSHTYLCTHVHANTNGKKRWNKNINLLHDSGLAYECLHFVLCLLEWLNICGFILSTSLQTSNCDKNYIHVYICNKKYVIALRFMVLLCEYKSCTAYWYEGQV